jgi:hypothetical protein
MRVLVQDGHVWSRVHAARRSFPSRVACAALARTNIGAVTNKATPEIVVTHSPATVSASFLISACSRARHISVASARFRPRTIPRACSREVGRVSSRSAWVFWRLKGFGKGFGADFGTDVVKTSSQGIKSAITATPYSDIPHTLVTMRRSALPNSPFHSP